MSVAVLVYAGVLELELGAALSVFSLAGGDGATRTVARSRASVVGSGGLVTTPEVMFAALEPPEGVFVPGGVGAARMSRDPLVQSFLRAQHARGVPMAASGSGVLALGEAGLLEGLVVSTSADLEDTVWGYSPSDVLSGGLSEDSDRISSHGGLGALDAALCLAARLWGTAAATGAARRLGYGAA
ncbi:DJ-1/PfpI family protein [Deinococcus peraridilitoris]|uniref:Transcriptional regulator containing an amidase domain and an AraC-type DNA-binding HTH domain protein n=1 Tax=Deinococcus peraridilitoris (strain DSM 19664 / LMG 22246 / CIP 109416 / KR-200) TaxID=937777 RepID=L0A771_DEIPD|nr:DJ-1/PfpI family protein [Deinococcus peraridilitoris]AFZ68905.1 transcriptional regulator containing an amidase domain and an AraC-type DNA-binding HTH domain protein [Deinococcus peraridilitoris DSM 19664]